MKINDIITEADVIDFTSHKKQRDKKTLSTETHPLKVKAGRMVSEAIVYAWKEIEDEGGMDIHYDYFSHMSDINAGAKETPNAYQVLVLFPAALLPNKDVYQRFINSLNVLLAASGDKLIYTNDEPAIHRGEGDPVWRVGIEMPK